VAEKVGQVLEFLFGCWHGHLSRPFTLSGWTYQVCLNCGKQFAYLNIDLGSHIPKEKQAGPETQRDASDEDSLSISIVRGRSGDLTN
jgi:hypothetical protein